MSAISSEQPKAGHCEICGGLCHLGAWSTVLVNGKFYHRMCVLNKKLKIVDQEGLVK